MSWASWTLPMNSWWEEKLSKTSINASRVCFCFIRVIFFCHLSPMSFVLLPLGSTLDSVLKVESRYLL